MKKVLLAVLVLVGVLVAVIATRPDTFHVERSTTIAALPAAVHDEVADLHRMEAWSPWTKLDPNMASDYSGAPVGVGQSYHWKGNGDVGEGRMTIAEDTPDTVGIRVDFVEPFPSTCMFTFAMAAEGTGTRVTWNMDGPLNFVSKAMCLVKSMDSMIGPDFERGLRDLKNIVESKSASAPAPVDSVHTAP